MKEDPRVGCLLAFALPFLTLSFGQAPSQAAMGAAGRLLEPHLPHLRPWEVSVLAWGAARLGYAPTPATARRLQERVAEILTQPPGSPSAFTPQVGEGRARARAYRHRTILLPSFGLCLLLMWRGTTRHARVSLPPPFAGGVHGCVGAVGAGGTDAGAVGG